MGEAGDEAAGKVEQNEARRAQSLLDCPAEQPQRPHVDGQMKPICVHELAGQERQNVKGIESQLTSHIVIGKSGREQPVLKDELLGQVVRQAALK